MSGFSLHPDALTDLDEIWEYITADNPGAASRVVEEIHEAIRALAPFPQVGHTCRHVGHPDLCFILREPTCFCAPFTYLSSMA